MDDQLPKPDIRAVAVPLESLAATAKSIAYAARRAGYLVNATRALGPRVPRQASQEVERQASTAIVGTMHGWTFSAVHTERDGWDVLKKRPGWPVAPSSITDLRATFKQQTPHDLGKAR